MGLACGYCLLPFPVEPKFEAVGWEFDSELRNEAAQHSDINFVWAPRLKQD
jgi:hypothetical protein